MVGFICCVIVLASVGAVKGLQGTPSMDDAGIPEELLDYFSHKLLPHDSHEAFLLESSRAVAPDADVGKDMVTIATERGYGIDTHFVTTKDGYILTMFNIARPRFSDPLATPRNTYPVILQHGLLDSSYTWVANYEKQSLGYLLADAGFDVWFGNNRGNRYGRNHTTLNPDGDEAFWSFTYDEMALYDVPAMIDYVTEFTSSKSTSWVGHSEGTIQMFAAGTITEQFDHVKSALSKLDLFVALAPVAYVKNLESKDLQFLARTNILDRMYKRGIYEFLAYGPLSEVAPRICQRTPEFCHVFLRTICGPTKNLNDSRIQVYVSETPAGTSTMNMYHWMQVMLTLLLEVSFVFIFVVVFLREY